MEYRSDILDVGAGTARVASNTLNKVVVVADIVDGAEHGDWCAIHLNNCKKLLVDNHTSQGVPLELHSFVHLQGFRKARRVDMNGTTCADVETTQVFEEGMLEKWLSMYMLNERA